MPIEIRPAIPADLPSLLDLYEQLAEGRGHHPLPIEAARPALAAIADQSPARTLLTALLDGEVAGTVDLLIMAPNLTHNGLPWAIAEHVVVHRARRGRGVGRALMEEAIRRARAAGCHRIELTSDNSRTDAHAFYRSLGFETSAQAFRLRLPE
jgi:GNAT superfamily N-acetyltransferase